MAHPIAENQAYTIECWAGDAWLQTKSRCRQRSGLVVALGLHGLRSIEVRRLTAAATDAATSLLTVPTAKRGTTRRIFLHPMLAHRLVEHARGNAKHAGLQFTSTTGEPLCEEACGRFLASACRDCGLPAYTFHCLRHTTAVRCYHATNGDVYAVQQLLGHATLSQTHVYLQGVIPVAHAGLPTWDARRRELHTLTLHVPAGRPRRTTWVWNGRRMVQLKDGPRRPA